MVALNGTQGLGPHQGHDVRLEPAAGGDDMPGVLAAHLLQYVQRVGNEGKLLQVPHRPDGKEGGGTLVHHQGVAVLEHPGQQPGDGHLALHIGVFSGGVGGRGLVAVLEHRTAVGTHGHALLLQPLQIPADGLLRHAELSAQLPHHHPGGGKHPVHNRLAPLCQQHRPPLLSIDPVLPSQSTTNPQCCQLESHIITDIFCGYVVSCG